MNVFFTSDLHLGHKNLLKLRCEEHDRTFGGVEGMNEWLINGWNSVVRAKDTVWVIGDVVWGKDNLHYLAQMNGHKRLVLGNHDTERIHIQEYLKYFDEVHGAIKKYGVVMTHVPIHPQELAYRWEYNVHGHIHHKERCIEDPRYINVNVDVYGNVPMNLDQLRAEMTIRKRLIDGNKVNSGSITE